MSKSARESGVPSVSRGERAAGSRAPQPPGTGSSRFRPARVGTALRQFADDASPALDQARRAEALGLDGVFVYDHLWPLGRPDRPALHSTTLLGALAAETSDVALGTLVARVGLVPDAVLVHTLVTLWRMTSGRFIAGLGSGDRANREENLAYGIPFPPAPERIARAVNCVRLLRAAGVRTWIGGLSRATRQAALEADGWNAWGMPVEDFATAAAELKAQRPDLEVTWGGQVLVGRTGEEAKAKLDRHGDRPGLVWGTVADVAAHLRRLTEAGASWTICAPIDHDVESVAEAAAGSLRA